MSINKPIIKNDYIYDFPDVCRAIGKHRMTMIRWEREGKFTPPRDFNAKRIFTKRQVEQIKKAFSPGGKGYWHFKPKIEDEGSESL